MQAIAPTAIHAFLPIPLFLQFCEVEDAGSKEMKMPHAISLRRELILAHY